MRFPLVWKIALASFVVVVAVVAFLTSLAWRAERRAIEDKFGLMLQHVAQTAALFVDGEDVKAIRTNADAEGESFRFIRQSLERVREANGLRPDQILIIRPAVGDEQQLSFVVMLQDHPFVGKTFAPVAEEMGVVRQVMGAGAATHTGIYTDAYGTFVSGFAPIRERATGKVVALLDVDQDVSEVVAALKRERMRALWTLPAALMLALGLSLLVAWSVTRAVRRLVAAAEAVERGDFDHRVDIRSRDELRLLGDAFNRMVAGLKERFAMLKFVPRHTRELIAQVTRAGGTDAAALGRIARKADVAVVFCDIRGFTSLSDRLEPARVVEMLNVYLRKEAELIEAAGGAVDKFIGDAVMGVFEGPDRFQRATSAALAIQRAVAELNRAHAFEREVQVGVGVAGGEVVMGSIGYEDRLEFAVIGRWVNLASRLCSVAQPGEVVVSDETHAAMGAASGGERVDGLKLKGFADAVTCWRLKN